MSKATANCTCKTCGKNFIHTAIKYNSREAAAYEAWAVEHITECPECYKARKDAEAQKATADCADLVGTEKQIAWATKIRASVIREYDAMISAGMANNPTEDQIARAKAVGEYIKSISSAAWYCDRGYDTPRTIVKAAAKEMANK